MPERITADDLSLSTPAPEILSNGNSVAASILVVDDEAGIRESL